MTPPPGLGPTAAQRSHLHESVFGHSSLRILGQVVWVQVLAV